MAAITFDTDFSDDSLFTFPGTFDELADAIVAEIDANNVPHPADDADDDDDADADND